MTTDLTLHLSAPVRIAGCDLTLLLRDRVLIPGEAEFDRYARDQAAAAVAQWGPVDALVDRVEPVDPASIRMPMLSGRRAPEHRDGPTSPPTLDDLMRGITPPRVYPAVYTALLTTAPPEPPAPRDWHNFGQAVDWNITHEPPRMPDLSGMFRSLSEAMAPMTAAVEDLGASLRRAAARMTLNGSFTIEVPVLDRRTLALYYGLDLMFGDVEDDEATLDRLSNTAAGIRARLAQLDAEERRTRLPEHDDDDPDADDAPWSDSAYWSPHLIDDGDTR